MIPLAEAALENAAQAATAEVAAAETASAGAVTTEAGATGMSNVAECLGVCNIGMEQLYWGLGGFALGLLLCLVIFVICKCKGKGRSLVVQDGERGCFVITGKALNDFVYRVVRSYSKLNLIDLRLKEVGEGYVMNLSLGVADDAEFSQMRQELRDKILAALEKQLGIGAEKISAINFEAVEFKGKDDVRNA